uniref:Uncharacterized protein LOC111128076 isoform X9 n=1 Tax=Crassostrea virginica TaxID=6565 RepID=A0A8B8DQU4_CRAVI|nr:uncharacterized protein LOC111128076 isoform X9 [Crassostrea virginica]
MAGVQPPQPYPVSITSSTRPLPQNYQQKPFAAGSAMQAETTMSPGASQRGPKVPQTVSRVESAEKASPMERPPDTGPRVKEQDPRLSPDISIVKVENELGPEETGMLDMYVSDMGRSGAGPSHGQNDEDQSDYDVEEPPGDMHRDEMSNESGNLSMDQSGNWYMGNFREHHQTVGNSSNTVDSKSRVQANLTFIAQTNGGSQVHIAERYTGSRNYKKSCVYCRSIGVTTNSGRTVETQWKCEQCGVALCIGKRNCFTLFHENLVQNEQE